MTFAERNKAVQAMRRAAGQAFNARMFDASLESATEAEYLAVLDQANVELIVANAAIDAAQAELDAECAAQPQPQGWVYGNE